MTAILQLPRVDLVVDTATNEDWTDAIAFVTAGSATRYAAAGNAGNGNILSPVAQAGAAIGDYLVTLTGTKTFGVMNPDGHAIGVGMPDIPFAQSGLGFTLSSGSTPFAVGDSFIVTVLPAPIDLTGLTFEMDARTVAGSATSYLYASTANGWLVNGNLSGTLSLAVPATQMLKMPAGAFVADILAHGDGLTRRCVTMAITLESGITAPRGNV